jgi:hypothetical protein
MKIWIGRKGAYIGNNATIYELLTASSEQEALSKAEAAGEPELADALRKVSPLKTGNYLLANGDHLSVVELIGEITTLESAEREFDKLEALLNGSNSCEVLEQIEELAAVIEAKEWGRTPSAQKLLGEVEGLRQMAEWI